MANKYDEELLRNLYLEQKMSVEAIAIQTNLPICGIRSKLGAMKIYKKKDYLSKSGNRPIKKEELINRLIPKLGISSEQADCLEKVTKFVLVKIIDAVEKQSNVDTNLSTSSSVSAVTSNMPILSADTSNIPTLIADTGKEI